MKSLKTRISESVDYNELSKIGDSFINYLNNLDYEDFEDGVCEFLDFVSDEDERLTRVIKSWAKQQK